MANVKPLVTSDLSSHFWSSRHRTSSHYFDKLVYIRWSRCYLLRMRLFSLYSENNECSYSHWQLRHTGRAPSAHTWPSSGQWNHAVRCCYATAVKITKKKLFFCYKITKKSYFHCTVKIMNAVILTGKIGKGRIKRKQNICSGVRTCIGFTSPLGLLPNALTTTPRRHT